MRGWNPKKVILFCGHRVRIVFKNGAKDKDLDHGKIHGILLSPTNERDHYLIKVSTVKNGFPVDEREQRDTLLHELIHLSNVSDDRSADVPERVVAKLANDLIEGFHEHPKIALWIATGEIKEES